ncbi:type I phosphomannose isomerase catalytic subunit [Clostridium transplantifaecale]|uniref:type I phosphomannose isomerase catalytic subunit n=1 Tax=Clostridium transplantifaecale TaxID=2479838 RepID=UPI000F641910|nr:type I phosphomannose isomerase catalytic subunit [Clostridium transplantifaecale]
MEPMLLRPVGKDYLWGGSRLKNEYYKDCPQKPLAETWECSVHPDGPSKIANGGEKGKTLAAVLHELPEYLGTKASGELRGELPILVKFIDAEKDLSVQVHPSDEYAREHEHQNGKTEMWYVLDAKPGATLVCGFAHDVTPEILRTAVETGTLGKHLQKVSVCSGDIFYIPAGTIHAIGKGILIAEIQESSNVTYRVYDYDRVDKNGQKRPLHFDKAVQVLNMKAGADVRQRPRKVDYYYGCAREILCRSKYFETERVRVNLGFSFTVMFTSFQVLLCINGGGGITSEGKHKPLRFKKGDCIFLPAGLGRCHVLGKCEMLKIRC